MGTGVEGVELLWKWVTSTVALCAGKTMYDMSTPVDDDTASVVHCQCTFVTLSVSQVSTDLLTAMLSCP